MHFNATYPFLWLLASALLAAGFSFLLYQFNPLKLPKKWMNYGMMFLRFLSIFFICFLLLEPMFKWLSQRKEKPLLILAIDNSESMVQGKDSSFVRRTLMPQIKQFKEALADRFQIESYTIGEQTQKSEDYSFNEKLTNISDALVQIENDQYNLNHAATVLISDGIYNQGSNPIYALNKKSAPVFTLAVGDSAQHRDALIKKVIAPTQVYAENDFELLLDLKAHFCSNELLQIQLREGDKILYAGNIKATGNNYFGTQKILLNKASEGIHTYEVSIKELSKEASYANNKALVQVNVLRSKQKVVLLYLNAHPDIAALQHTMQANANYEIISSSLANFQLNQLAEAAVVVLHQIPGARGEGMKLTQQLKQSNTPVIYITGKQSGLNYFNQVSPIKIIATTQNFNESQAWVNTQFNLFQLDDDMLQTLQKLYPLITPYGNYQVAADAQILFYQQVGYVKTNTPLIAFANAGGQQQAFIFGEGFWRWRLQDYFLNGNQQITQSLISKMLQWTSGKTDRSKFRVNPSKKFFDENEPITIDAELYNDLYERINNADISLELKNQDGKLFSYQFNKTNQAYQLNVGNLKPGTYSYEAKVNGGAKLDPKKGKFMVKALQTEALQTRANYESLMGISEETGGNFYLSNELQKLQENLLANQEMKTVVYQQESLKELLNQKWLFFLIVFLLTAEWFIRKWNGFI
ncbi:MAG: hypothetical protein SGJ00_13010 [bacterium]|nr:hypothetical protein [bacterium]